MRAELGVSSESGDGIDFFREGFLDGDGSSLDVVSALLDSFSLKNPMGDVVIVAGEEIVWPDDPCAPRANIGGGFFQELLRCSGDLECSGGLCISEDVEEFLDDGRDCARKLGAIGEIDLRFKATIRLPPVSDSLSDLPDFRPRPKASEGDREEMEDWESRWKCCRLSFITSAHSSVSGVDM